jgi:hypothetical protein
MSLLRGNNKNRSAMLTGARAERGLLGIFFNLLSLVPAQPAGGLEKCRKREKDKQLGLLQAINPTNHPPHDSKRYFKTTES